MLQLRFILFTFYPKQEVVCIYERLWGERENMIQCRRADILLPMNVVRSPLDFPHFRITFIYRV